jgi:hypothetical protein
VKYVGGNDVAGQTNGQRRAVEAVGAELRIAQQSEEVAYVGKRVKVTESNKRSSVEIDVVAKKGLEWIEVKNTEPFGLRSEQWSSDTRAARRNGKTRNESEDGNKPNNRRGLKEQVEYELMASVQHKVDGQAPRVVVHFAKSASYEVAEALKKMSYADPVTGEIYSVEVRGVIEPPQIDHLTYMIPWPLKRISSM